MMKKVFHSNQNYTIDNIIGRYLFIKKNLFITFEWIIHEK